MAEDTILVRALRPFRMPSGIWIMPGNVVSVAPGIAEAGFKTGACVPARTGVDEAAVIKLRETEMVRAIAPRNGKCRLTPSVPGRQRNLSRSKT
jgi:hypothetical protein